MAVQRDIKVTITGDATPLRRELDEARRLFDEFTAHTRRPAPTPWADLYRWQREQPWYRRVWYAIRGKALLPPC